MIDSIPNLSRSPITEALINIRARAQSGWDSVDAREQVKIKTPEYSCNFGLRRAQLQSTDKLYHSQINRNGFVFSRLQPYPGWDQFIYEARRLISVYMEIAKPLEIAKLELRYINRFALPSKDFCLEDYLRFVPQTASSTDFSHAGFFYLDILRQPHRPYLINLIRTVQSSQGFQSDGDGLIMDIEVFTPKLIELSIESLAHRLDEMREIKNEIFFANIAPKALEMIK
ncbi:MAG: TIGR04255 family protein [Candidatus Sumerlaeota bacterium]|nr:TIGR04255 family protein [Candidatus Sumerlaeota bacterium]